MTAPCWEVRIVNPLTGKPKVWNSYPDREAAELQAAKLRAKRMYAEVRRVDAEVEQPEHNGDRRRGRA